MQCPACKDVTLVMSDRQGVEVDYCPQCRGVWLDRGELDKIIDRSAAIEYGSAPPSRRAEPPPRRDYGDDDHGRRHQHQHPRKKKGLLGDIFDF